MIGERLSNAHRTPVWVASLYEDRAERGNARSWRLSLRTRKAYNVSRVRRDFGRRRVCSESRSEMYGAGCGCRWLPAFSVVGSVCRGLSRKKQKQPEAAVPAPDFARNVRPILQTYCFGCHGPSKRRGGLDLERFDDAAHALDQVDLWDQVKERLDGKEMPPQKSKQPTEEERRTLMAWVRHVDESQVTCEDLSPAQLRSR